MEYKSEMDTRLAGLIMADVADTIFFVFRCRKYIRVAVKFDDMPEAVWYKKEELASRKNM